MLMKKIPHSDLSVSSLCLGTMTFGTPVAEPEAIFLTQAAIDRGINFIDTANMYEGYTRFLGSAGGVAEEILGKALKGRRSQVVLATKVGMKIGPMDDDQGLSRIHILREIDRSLARLKTDQVDLYYLHKPDVNIPMEESVQTLEDLRIAGKIREWAVSNFSTEQLSALLALCDQGGWKRPVAIQPAYSYLKRDIEKDLLPLCEREEIAVIPYQVLQGGLLTGKYKRNAEIPPGSRMIEKPEWTMALSEVVLEQLEKCEKEAEKLGRSMMQHALKSLLDQKSVVSLIVGVKTLPQLEALISAVD
ncbi:MAG: aldo/keto reductase [Chloroflexi bacterium]|nr:aldo/keto reductase [Chloroflexota bacterium]